MSANVSDEPILKSLELVSEICGDPTERIYQALFKARPDLEPLFVLDTDGGVRGSMLQHTLECVVDYAEGQDAVTHFIASYRLNHDGYGLPDDDVFDAFFVVVRDTFQAILGDRWSGDMTQEWDKMLGAFAAMG